MVSYPRVFLEVNNDLIKDVKNHLIDKKIIPNCDLYGIAGINVLA